MFFDSHAHLDMPQFDADRPGVVARARDAGVTHILTVGTDLASSQAAIGLALEHSGVWAAVGFHPHDARRLDELSLARLRDLAREPGVVAVGEIGLDFYRDLSPRSVQMDAFQQQLELAAEVDLPVVVHDREAHVEVLAVLRQWVASHPGRIPGVMHCFSGDWRLAEEYLELGFLISLAGPVTYPRAERANEVARRVPLPALLIETDSPYLAPQSYRGRRNEPAYVAAVAAHIADLRGLPVEEIATCTADNAIRLFGLA